MIEKLCCLGCVKLTQLQPDNLIIEIKKPATGITANTMQLLITNLSVGN
jgi:hypothetical protein